jgi:hypothetical protein
MVLKRTTRVWDNYTLNTIIEGYRPHISFPENVAHPIDNNNSSPALGGTIS